MYVYNFTYTQAGSAFSAPLTPLPTELDAHERAGINSQKSALRSFCRKFSGELDFEKS